MGVWPEQKPRTALRYQLGEAERASYFSAFGLWQLLEKRDLATEIWFLLTPKARETQWQEIRCEASRVGVAVQAIDLTGDMDDTYDFLEQTANRIPKGCQLTLNVTEGLRHHAFLFYALALYLTAFRDVRLEGAWYCRLETENWNDPKPLIDLKPILDLAYWFHALVVFRETGSLREVARRLTDEDVKERVDQLSTLFLNGMPLEAGNKAARILAFVSQHAMVTDVPLAEQLQDVIIDSIRPLAGVAFEPQPKKSQADTSKKALPLNLDELRRQAKYIQSYFDTGQLNLAFGLMREWVINWIAFQRKQTSNWLDRPTREKIERNLGGLAEVLKAKDPADAKRKLYKHAAVRKQLTESQKVWGKRWNTVCDLRNALQHHGMKAGVFEPHRGDIQRARSDWEQWEQWETPPEFGGGHGRLLICPIGKTPGVLYSAIGRMALPPDRVLAICSEESRAWLDEAMALAKCDAPHTVLLLRDPFKGLGEFAELIAKASQWLFEADDIHANLTGGPTLMSVLVGQLVKRAEREYQRPVREFLLIDPRPPEQQRSDPWHLGDLQYLDDRLPTKSDTSDLEAHQPGDDSSKENVT